MLQPHAFECLVYDKAFSTPQALEQHQEDTDHVLDCTCQACGRTFSTLAALEQHSLATGCCMLIPQFFQR